ncbi:hypothetical protein AALO_G00088630 [Alosa alosa]|uniref:Uncharacterized protein n=1 Tax=Alosa alosa TaxID=278164 RepID=A0AAV6H039_9TELE|nr:hypothetical protein AALO_G00088630 [Alosa alosa]
MFDVTHTHTHTHTHIYAYTLNPVKQHSSMLAILFIMNLKQTIQNQNNLLQTGLFVGVGGGGGGGVTIGVWGVCV